MKYKISRVNQFSANDWSYLGSTLSDFDSLDLYSYFCQFYLVELHGEHFLHVKEVRYNITVQSTVIFHWRIYVSEWRSIEHLVARLLYVHKYGERVSAQKVIRFFKRFENVSE